MYNVRTMHATRKRTRKTRRRFNFVLSEQDETRLAALTANFESTASAVIRRLLREAYDALEQG